MSGKLGAKLWVRTSHFGHSIDSAGNLVQKHPFNHKLQLLLPSLPEQQKRGPQVPDLSAFYYSIYASLAVVTDPDFIRSFSADTAFSCICLNRSRRAVCTPDAHLHLVVSKNEYQRLGIPGARILSTDDFHIDVGLTAADFKPGNHQYDRIRRCLQHELEPVHLLCIRVHHDAVAEIDFAGANGLLSSECIAHEHQQTTSSGIQAPTVSYIQRIAESAAMGNTVDSIDTHENYPIDHLHELHEWIGGVSCGLQGCEWHNLDEQHMEDMTLQQDTWTGLVAPCQVQEAVKLGRQLVEDSICPWAIVSVWGFTGQPVSWMGSPPNSASSERGQNDYSIVILPAGRYVLLVASGDGDTFQTV